MRGATRALPKRSPILVLLSPKHVYLRSSDGIRCISAGMIAPVTSFALIPYRAPSCPLVLLVIPYLFARAPVSGDLFFHFMYFLAIFLAANLRLPERYSVVGINFFL